MHKTLFRMAVALGLGAGLSVGLASSAVAQGVTTGAISGTVTDQAGQPLSGAQVSVTDTRTGATSGGITSNSGRFRIGQLSPGGPYTVRVQLIGYRAEERLNVRVSLSSTETFVFQLEQTAVEVAPISVSVESNPIFSSTRTGTEITVTREEIDNFPTLGRQINTFALLSPQVNFVEGAPSIAGQNNRFNNIQIDGAVNNDIFGLADSGIPGGQISAKAISIEAIGELQVLTAPFDVRYSKFTGGLINAVTKSGTNEWSGSAFGFYSGDSFVSDLDGESFGDFNDTQFGWTLGGPIIRDKLFLFTNGEFEINSSPTNPPQVSLGGAIDDDALDAGIHPDSASRLVSILEGMEFEDVGSPGQLSIDNPRTNLFARLDWNMSDNHRSYIRWNYSRAKQNRSPFRGFGDHGFESVSQDFESTTNSVVGQLFSSFGSWEGELLVTYETVRDRRNPFVPWPFLEVDNTSNLNGDLVGRTLTAGAEEFSQANRLDQDIFQLTYDLTRSFGDHDVTFGTHNERFAFDNLFFPQSIGVYEFESLADLENGAVDRYTVNTIVPGNDNPAANWSTWSFGFYAQDNWSVNQNLNITGGLRVDIPTFPDQPRNNPDFEAAFGFSNSDVPSGNILWQPRVGFNWNSLGERQTQIRGGAGLFAGRPPYVWLSNMYTNTGADLAILTCSGANAPPLVRANYPDSPPQACLDGTTADPRLSFINVTDPDFKLPLDWKFSLGIDQELPWGLSGTVELLYSKAANSVFFRELNIPSEQIGTDPTQGNRPLFGTPTSSGFAVSRPRADFAHVVQVTNQSENKAFLLTAALNRRFSDWLALRSSYTYADVQDLQSLFSSQATSNYGRTPIRGDPNDPELATSAFEVRHKVVLSATGFWRFGDSGFDIAITPQYFGNSGPAYSYIARGDLNGDGYRASSPRISRDNDLVYIPNNTATEYTFDLNRSPNGAAELEDLINEFPCLSEQRGSLMKRNTCRAPWQSAFNLRAALGLPGGWSRGRAQLVIDVFNLFGTEVVQHSNIDRGIQLLRVRGRVNDDPNGALMFEYTGPTRDADGKLDPFRTLDRRSRRALQIGLRYVFGPS